MCRSSRRRVCLASAACRDVSPKFDSIKARDQSDRRLCTGNRLGTTSKRLNSRKVSGAHDFRSRSDTHGSDGRRYRSLPHQGHSKHAPPPSRARNSEVRSASQDNRTVSLSVDSLRDVVDALQMNTRNGGGTHVHYKSIFRTSMFSANCISLASSC